MNWNIMKTLCTLKAGMKVTVWRKTHSEFSTITDIQIGKMFTVKHIEEAGRKHNRYVAFVTLVGAKGKECRACLDELARCNPNFEPEGEFIVCVGCGATVADSDLRGVKDMPELTACPSCGMINPTVS